MGDNTNSELVWYFAYGSNMHNKVLRRRRVVPKASVPAKLPGWRLTYDLRGFPFVEPAFADIEPLTAGDTTPDVQGVCHQITAAEWEGIKSTEGGGGVYIHGYHTVNVNPIPLTGDKTPIKAVSLSVGNDPAVKFRNSQLHLPSRRYINLLVEGAKHFQLEPAYVDWLETHDSYESAEHVKHKFLYWFAMSGLMVFALPVFFIFFINNVLLRRLPARIYKKLAYPCFATTFHIATIVWLYHDALHWIFGRFGWMTVECGGSKNIKCSPRPNGHKRESINPVEVFSNNSTSKL